MFQNLSFIVRYLFAISSENPQYIESKHIDSALKTVFSGVDNVGDKHPDYIYFLHELVKDDKLSIIVIYRDPRDVVNSTLEAYIRWKKWWPDETGISEKIAERWVNTIETIEALHDHLHIIRYEDLVSYPQPELKALGNLFDVDPIGFSYRTDSPERFRGKYRQNFFRR